MSQPTRTVEQHINDIADALDTNAPLCERATDLISTYGDETRARHTPRVAAAASIYTAAKAERTDHTQTDIANAADVNRNSISTAYNRIVTAYDEQQRPD